MRAVLRSLLSALYLVDLRRRGIYIGKGSYISGRPIITRCSGSKITIGKNFISESVARRQIIGVSHPVIIRTVNSGAVVEIGDDCGVSGVTIVASKRVLIGDGALLGADCVIIDTNFHPVDNSARRYAPKPDPMATDAVDIGRNVFIGTRAMILPGVSLGDNCVVAAGSIVTHSFPPNSLIAGSPARFIREVSAAKSVG